MKKRRREKESRSLSPHIIEQLDSIFIQISEERDRGASLTLICARNMDPISGIETARSAFIRITPTLLSNLV